MENNAERNGNLRGRGRSFRKAMAYAATGAVLVCGGWYLGQFQSAQADTFTATPGLSLPTQHTTEKVMVIGGSMAHGWKDPNDNSYLKRAFKSLSDSTNTTYEYDDRTVIGGSPVSEDKNGKYAAWLGQDKPQVVVISWGLLNDVYNHTPIGPFTKAIHDEVQEALDAGAVVLFVTSPVTKATATYNHTQVERYINTEIAQANAFSSPNVYFINLNDDMSVYMAAHGQTWKQYFGDSWHPNQAGHVLAGELLDNDLIGMFGVTPILFQTATATGSGSSNNNSTANGTATANSTNDTSATNETDNNTLATASST